MKKSPLVLASALVLCAGLGAAQADAAPSSARNPAKFAFLVSQASPLLDKAAKRAVSQDFNGAPLSSHPAIHQIKAEDVGCRSRSHGKAMTLCTLTFAHNRAVTLKGSKAQDLFDAMEALGIEGSAGMGHIEISLTGLNCTVDDAKAQNTPARGDDVAGFACEYSAN